MSKEEIIEDGKVKYIKYIINDKYLIVDLNIKIIDQNIECFKYSKKCQNHEDFFTYGQYRCRYGICIDELVPNNNENYKVLGFKNANCIWIIYIELNNLNDELYIDGNNIHGTTIYSCNMKCIYYDRRGDIFSNNRYTKEHLRDICIKTIK